jgi:SAM-dependent methyltransferase
VRRFLFTDAFLVRFGRFVPLYGTNANQANAAPVVDKYSDAIERSGLPVRDDRVILEIGSGATNSVGYELLRRKIAGTRGRIFLFEPYVAVDRDLDQALRIGWDGDSLARVERITSLEAIDAHSIDLVLSNSVLEHVVDLDGLLNSLKRVLKLSGSMIHGVDYRDHFFKYPYHFLTFTARVWERWLNPGDLPRWRLGSHVDAFSRNGFSTSVLDQVVLQDAFDRIRTSVSRDFDAEDPAVSVATALLINRNLPPESALRAPKGVLTGSPTPAPMGGGVEL